MAELENCFDLEIITPTRVFYRGQASMVEFTAEDGQIGVYKRHIPLSTVVAPGILTIHEPEGNRIATLMDGFAQILPDSVTIMTEIAEWPDEIDKGRAQAARERAEERLKNHEAEIDVLRAETALKKALIRLDVVK